MDPVSIAGASLSVAKACVSVGWELKQFIQAASLAGTAINAIAEDVESFEKTLLQMNDAFGDESIKAALKGSGHIGTHWRDLRTSLDDAEKTMTAFNATIQRVNRSTKFMDSTRKLVRLKGATAEIAIYQQQIRRFRDTIQVSLQITMFWHQVTAKESSDKVLPALYQLESTIREQAIDMNHRLAQIERNTESEPTSSSTDEPIHQTSEITTLTNLRSCLRSAATVVSSASTIYDPKTGGDFHGSDFGDIFPPQINDHVLDWVRSNEVAEVDRMSINRSTSTAVEKMGDWDSDEEERLEMIQALLDQGRSKVKESKHSDAEKDFRNCLGRFSQEEWPQGLRREVQAERLETLHQPISVLLAQEKWHDAQEFLKIKISSAANMPEIYPPSSLARDKLKLSKILLAGNDLSEALLYARQAYRAFRHQGAPDKDWCKLALETLIEVCLRSGQQKDAEAYSAVLSQRYGPKSSVSIRSNLPKQEASGVVKSTHPPKQDSAPPLVDTNTGDQSQRSASNSLAGHGHKRRKDTGSPLVELLPARAVRSLQHIWRSPKPSSYSNEGLASVPNDPNNAISPPSVEQHGYDQPLADRSRRAMNYNPFFQTGDKEYPAPSTLSSEWYQAPVSDIMEAQIHPRQSHHIRYASKPHKILAGHKDLVDCVAFGRNGMLASGSFDKSVKLWDANSGGILETFRGHTNAIWSVDISPDGRLLASLSTDGTVKLWDRISGKCAQDFTSYFKPGTSVKFSPDGSRVAWTLQDGDVMLYDRRSERRDTLRNSFYEYSEICFSSDGVSMASVSHTGSVRLWEVDSKKVQHHYGSSTIDPVKSVGFLDGVLMIAFVDKILHTIILWNAQSAKVLHLLRGHEATIHTVSFSSDGAVIASASVDTVVKLWDVKSGELLQTFEEHRAFVSCVAFSHGRPSFLAFGCRDKTVRIWKEED